MWIIIWAIFAFLMLGFAAWNMMIMFQQKDAWKKLSEKRNLNYEPTGFMTSPNVHGKLDKALFSLFSGVQQTDDVRGQRFVTALEFQMGKGLPTGGALGTKQMKPFIDTLIFSETYEPGIEEWKDDYVLRVRDEEGAQAYLTEERLKALCSVFKMTNATVLFFFDEIEAVLRVETSDPLRNAEKLDKIVARLQDVVKTLTPSIEEKRRYQTLLRSEEKRQAEKEKKKLEYDPELDEIDLELEDDDAVKAEKPKSSEPLTLEEDSSTEIAASAEDALPKAQADTAKKTAAKKTTPKKPAAKKTTTKKAAPKKAAAKKKS